MTRVERVRCRTGLLWMIGLMLLGCLQPGMAADVRKKALIMIKIKADKDANGNVIGCSLEVGPRGVGVCYSGTGPGVAGGDCNNFVNWRWIGNDHGYTEILITEKANSPAKNCFNLGANGLSITGTGRSNQQSRTTTCNPSPGDPPFLWTYKVEAIHSEEDKNCDMDPGVVIER